MRPNAGAGGATGSPSTSIGSTYPPRRVRPPARSKLRNGTWIIPRTGERSRRQFTLRNHLVDGSSSGADDDDDDDDDHHLRSLGEGNSLYQKAANLLHNIRVAVWKVWALLMSPKGRGTIKCSVAYLLASMGTFYHPAAKFLGPMDGKHIVATIVTYFHPARSAGSQIEAVAISIAGVCYAMFIGICSMATSVLIGDVWDQRALSYVVVLLVYIGFGLGFVGWVKQKLNNPLVGVGCSIASIGIITIITKEGSVHDHVFSERKIIQYLKILLMATVISTVVNLLLWPQSARHALRTSMRVASTSLGEMLAMVAAGFLSGAEEDFASNDFTKSSDTFGSALRQMNKDAKEAKYEYYFLGRERVYRHDKAVVKSMESLAQSLGGLRSAANTQFELLKEVASGPLSTASVRSAAGNVFSPFLGRSLSSSNRSGGRFGYLEAIDEAPDERSDREEEETPLRDRTPGLRTPSGSSFKTPSEIFELFIARLGPSMKSLVHTMAEMLKEPPFGASDSAVEIHEQFKQSLGEAISLYNQARGKALEELYKTIELARPRSETVQADFEEVAAACGHFSFSLLSFADEMSKYLDALEDLKYVERQKTRTWTWMKVWKNFNFRKSAKQEEDPERITLLKPIKRMRQSQMPKGIPDAMKNGRHTFYNWDMAPEDEGAWNRFVRSVFRSLMAIGKFMARDDIRFGLKVGVGAALYAMFAFIPATRPFYNHWRGEWGLLSFMIVCSITVGASNATGLARFTGTVIGAVCVVINWMIADGNPVGLALLGCAVSFGAFYVIVGRGNGPFGRFVLLSYNVSSLYAYSLSQQVEDDDDDEGGLNPRIREIAMHRVVAVTAGILWGLVVCRLIWPMPARKTFKEGVSVLYLQMGLIWKRGPLAILLRGSGDDHHRPDASYMRLGEQSALQRYAAKLQSLRQAARNEFEPAAGPFPFEAFGRVLASTQRVLDAFHAMSLVTQKHGGRLSEGERALLHHTADERAQLCARICHVFQVLASSLMLEYPLTDAVPGVMPIRDRLLGKVFRFRKEHTESVAAELARSGLGIRQDAAAAVAAAAAVGGPSSGEGGEGGGGGGEDRGDENDRSQGENEGQGEDNEGGGGEGDTSPTMLGPMGRLPKLGDVTLEEPDYALLYAYALVTGQVAKELKKVEKEVEGLYGRLDEDALLLE
ncbi:ribosomal protein L19 [Xylariaceae sp. FL0804]|nr:ribosomal protein L19 [Xylariaceae sp. FL0804]